MNLRFGIGHCPAASFPIHQHFISYAIAQNFGKF